MRYPFAALVGQEQLKLALLLNAIDPSLGGVIVCGEKGTAKSTAARAVVDLLPTIRVRENCPYHTSPEDPSGEGTDAATFEVPVPFVELPLGATEDRVVGTLDLQVALRDRQRAFHPGLLAAANRGILYVDEINLLADHLVDLLLDAAASGVNVVQREGIEITHPARFMLIGTMNPEEGQLRPQLLDRFGLMVQVAAPRDPVLRVEVIRRRMAFESDSQGFAAKWQAEQDDLRRQVVEARQHLTSVAVSDEILHLICHICCEMQVDGLRADIAMQRAARAIAAFESRSEVTTADVRRAAELVLPHRRRRQPFEKPGIDPQQLDDLLPRDSEPSSDSQCCDGNDACNEPPKEGEASDAEPTTFPAAPTNGTPEIRLSSPRNQPTQSPGRRNPTPQSRTGRFVRAVADPQPTSLAVGATLRSAAVDGSHDPGLLTIRPTDLHRQERRGAAGSLVLFVVDASGSMAARRRMEAVKGAALSLLADAYEQRDRVGVIAFRGPQAELLLPPTGSLDLARDAFEQMPTGGRTPLADALMLAAETIQRAKQSHPDLLTLIVLLTDGKANVSLPGQAEDPWEQTLQAAAHLAQQHVSTLVLDTDQGFVRLGRASEVAEAVGGEYCALDDLSADGLAMEIEQRRPSNAAAARARRTRP